MQNLSARYSSVSVSAIRKNETLNSAAQTGPDVLHNVSFSVKAGERIGVGKLFDLSDQLFC